MSGMTKIEFEIPGLPKGPNGGYGSWQGKHFGEREKWLELVGIALLGKIPKERFWKARATFTRYSSVEPDGDNLQGSFKNIRDFLKLYAIIVDDKSKHLEAFYRWEHAKRGEGRIKVTVEKIL